MLDVWFWQTVRTNEQMEMIEFNSICPSSDVKARICEPMKLVRDFWKRILFATFEQEGEYFLTRDS